MSTSIVEPLVTECDILDRIVHSDEVEWSENLARAILQLDFTPRDRQRMHELAEKNQGDKLNAAESQEMESYRKVGFLLDLLRSKARLSLSH